MNLTKKSKQKDEQRYNLRFKPDATALREKLKSMSFGERVFTREKLAKGCMVKPATISNWCLGLTRIPALHKCKIEEILGEKIFDTQTNC